MESLNAATISFAAMSGLSRIIQTLTKLTSIRVIATCIPE